MEGVNQVNGNEVNQKDAGEQDLLLIDAYSLAANFFLFALVLVMTLANPSLAKTYIPGLVILGAISAIGFFVFTVLMFKPYGMRKFREWLRHPQKWRPIWYIFRALLWFSLPIVFFAGLADILGGISPYLRPWILGIGCIWLIFVPLGAVVKLRVGGKWSTSLSIPKLLSIKTFFKAVYQKIVASIRSKGPLQFLLIAIAVGAVQMSAFMIPTFQWLPSPIEADSFLKTLWQVHASILGVTIIVVTIIITVIANEKDRTRTWKLYTDKTKFVPVIWFNLLAIVSEGFALLQATQATNPLFSSDKVGNLILSEGVLLIISIIIAAMLFTVTVKFLDDDYVEDLAEKRIVRAMPAAFEDNIKHIHEVISQLRNKTNGN